MARRDGIPVDAPKMPPATALRVLARVGRFVAPYRGRIAVALVALVVAAAATLALGQAVKIVIDRGFLERDAAALDGALAASLAVIVAMALATYVRFYNVSWLGERVTADLRRAVFDHLLGLPPGWFELYFFDGS